MKFGKARGLLKHKADHLCRDAQGNTPLFSVLKKRDARSCQFAMDFLNFCKQEGKDMQEVYQGRIQDFHLGGGGGKRLCARTRIKIAKPEVPYGRGPGPVKGSWKLSGFLRLSLVLSEPYLSILIQNGIIKETIVDQNLGGGGAPVAPPLNPSLGTYMIGKPLARVKFWHFVISPVPGRMFGLQSGCIAFRGCWIIKTWFCFFSLPYGA